MTVQENPTVDQVKVPSDRDTFMRTLIGHLAKTLEEVVGIENASGYISIVGQRIGDEINDAYRKELSVSQLNEEQVAEVMVNLKSQIEGDFYIIEQDSDKIVLGNRACPFGEKVIGRPSLCMMTSNVFGVIAAENLGYGKVVLEETIAQGAPGCRVVIHLNHENESGGAQGREYFAAR